MYYEANAGHIGSSLSCTEVLTFMKFNWMRDSDELILSKGHAAAVLYSVWAEAGILSEADIKTFYKNGTLLSAHPPVNKIKGIPFATGSLGHGLGLAAGLGLASKLKKNDKCVFCVTSDGEVDEGSTWEAALFIVAQKLTNVVWVIDRNNLQGFGYTEEVMPLEPLDEKLAAFGFDVLKIDGHDFSALAAAKQHYEGSNKSKPLVIIANTMKGNGWEDFQGQVACHYLPMNETQFNKIMSNY